MQPSKLDERLNRKFPLPPLKQTWKLEIYFKECTREYYLTINIFSTIFFIKWNLKITEEVNFNNLCDQSSSNLPSNVTLERQKKKKRKENSNWNFLEIVDRGTPFDGMTVAQPVVVSILARIPAKIPFPPLFSRPPFILSLSVGRGRIQKREAASIKKTNILLQYAFAYEL